MYVFMHVLFKIWNIELLKFKIQNYVDTILSKYTQWNNFKMYIGYAVSEFTKLSLLYTGPRENINDQNAFDSAHPHVLGIHWMALSGGIPSVYMRETVMISRGPEYSHYLFVFSRRQKRNLKSIFNNIKNTKNVGIKFIIHYPIIMFNISTFIRKI